MKAAVLEAFGEPMQIHRDWPDPECGPKDVVLEIKGCGVCRSDYTLWQGGFPLRVRGRHLRLGVSNKQDDGRIPIPVDMFTFRELSFIGSFGMQAARYPEMFDLIASGKVSPDRLVGDTVALEDASDVLASMASYDTLAMPVITRF